MSAADPIAVLAKLDRPAAPRTDFAEALLATCLLELWAPVRRSRSALGWLPQSRVLRAAIAIAVFLVLAGVATATYFAVRGSPATPAPSQAQVTVITSTGGGMSLAEIAAVGPGGRLRILWRCPERVFCGELTSVAWSPDGKRLAVTLDEIGGRSGYVGLHVFDLATGTDTHIGSLPIPHISRAQPTSILGKLVRLARQRLGCILPSELAWAPDSKRLAYSCGDDLLYGAPRSVIYVMRADGTGRKLLPTGTPTAYWPTWSPDGKQLAFATEPAPRVAFRRDSTEPIRKLRSSVYVVSPDGTGRALVATDASVPTWSPDGRSIAYDSACGGIRIASAAGVDITPGAASNPCRVIGLRGRPAWSPDGTALAIGATRGVYVVGADGQGLHRLTSESSMGVLGDGRPAWTPRTVHGRWPATRSRGGL